MIFTSRVINIVMLMKGTAILRATHIARTERENIHSEFDISVTVHHIYK